MKLVVKHHESSDPRFADASVDRWTRVAVVTVVMLGLVGAAVARLLMGLAWNSNAAVSEQVVMAVYSFFPLSLSAITVAFGLAMDQRLRQARGLRWASAVVLVVAVMPFDHAVGPLGFGVNAVLLVGAGLLVRRGYRASASSFESRS